MKPYSKIFGVPPVGKVFDVRDRKKKVFPDKHKKPQSRENPEKTFSQEFDDYFKQKT